MSIYKQQRQQIKVLIQETSVSLFKDIGYENVTIDEITKRVGIAKGTFYNFYSSKLDILMLWAEQEFSKLDFMEAMNPNKTINENLNILIIILSKAIKKQEKLFKHFILEIIKVYGDSRFSGKFDFIAIFTMVIKSSKDFNPIGIALLDEKIDMLNSTMFMGIVSWFNKASTSKELEEYLHNLIRVCLGGITTNFEGNTK